MLIFLMTKLPLKADWQPVQLVWKNIFKMVYDMQ